MKRLLFLALLLVGCRRDEAGAGAIVVGYFGSMTGSEATFGQLTHDGVKLAVEELNAAGGVGGRKIVVKAYDTQGRAQEAGTAVTRLITDDKAVAVIGENASALSIAGGRIAQRYGVPLISPSSTNPQVTQIGDMIFRVCFIDTFQGYVIARFTREHLKLSKVAVLYDQASPYSTGLRDDFRRELTQRGGTVVTEQAYTGGDTDFGAQLTSIRETAPEAVFVPGYYTDAGNIMVQGRKLGLKMPFLGGDGWESPQLGKIAGAAADGSYFAAHYSPEDQRAETKTFVSRFKQVYGMLPDSTAALGYDSARLLFDAMKRAGGTDGKALAAAIAATRDFQGVTGTFSIDEGRNAKKPAVILTMQDAQPRFVTSVPPL
jgi:branched-chain amino acid transport system substrate-binding protein